MSVNEFYLEFHAIDSRIKSGKYKSSEKPYLDFALKMFKQADCKTLSLEDAIQAVELLNDLNVKLHQEFLEAGEGQWLSTIADYKTLKEKEMVVFVLYPIGATDSSEEPKICVVEIP
ncbi:MAG: hypothetical protein GOP50_03295 [Candidatus Heimdallarchaeota archaeon]|nr:hypothetical protein [Candidatus Heimdallarchaeota archaeon]